MWCARCQADVAAEAAPDNQRVFCTSCGSDLTAALGLHSSRPEQAPTKDPHELLARWAGSQILDPFGPLLAEPGSNRPTSPETEWAVGSRQRAVNKPGSNRPTSTETEWAEGSRQRAVNEPGSNRPTSTETSGYRDEPPAYSAQIPPPQSYPNQAPPHQSPPAQRSRVDAAHVPENSEPQRQASRSGPHPNVSFESLHAPELPAGYRVHQPTALDRPHFDFHVVPAPAAKSTNWMASAGQIFAYLGVGILTVGTVMVLVGYFGGPAQYAPTGWLITTAGQMVLFLGVVTLVSGGMEQTTQEVVRRIDHLGEKIVRIEQNSQSSFPRGPSFPIEPDPHFANPASSVEQQLREQISHLQRQLERQSEPFWECVGVQPSGCLFGSAPARRSFEIVAERLSLFFVWTEPRAKASGHKFQSGVEPPHSQN